MGNGRCPQPPISRAAIVAFTCSARLQGLSARHWIRSRPPCTAGMSRTEFQHTAAYATLAGAVEELAHGGFKEGFRVVDDRLQALGTGELLRPEDLLIREYHRFEGFSDPDDIAIVYALESKGGVRGTVTDAYGVYSDPAVSALLADVPIQETYPKASTSPSPARSGRPLEGRALLGESPRLGQIASRAARKITTSLRERAVAFEIVTELLEQRGRAGATPARVPSLVWGRTAQAQRGKSPRGARTSAARRHPDHDGLHETDAVRPAESGR